ncbi:MAG: putative zinc-binding protein [Exilispira sp.]
MVINAFANKCASKIIEQKGIKATFEYTISEKDVEKIPTLDFDQEDVDRITDEIVKNIKK